MTTTAERPTVTPERPALRRTGDWARRAPLLPALVFLIIVTQLPFVGTLAISFMNWNAYYPGERGFAGFDNFVRVLTDVTTREAIVTTIVLTVSVVLLSLVLGMLIALLLDRAFLGRGFVRTMMITPFLVVPVAAALVWKHALYTPITACSTGCSPPCSGATPRSRTGSPAPRSRPSWPRWCGSGPRS